MGSGGPARVGSGGSGGPGGSARVGSGGSPEELLCWLV